MESKGNVKFEIYFPKSDKDKFISLALILGVLVNPFNLVAQYIQVSKIQFGRYTYPQKAHPFPVNFDSNYDQSYKPKKHRQCHTIDLLFNRDTKYPIFCALTHDGDSGVVNAF